MVMASNAYVPPGVTVSEVVDPSISPLLATASTVGLIGLAEGFITKTDTVMLSGEAAVTLPGVETTDSMGTEAVLIVVDAINPSISEGLSEHKYAEGKTGFIFSNTAHTIKRGAESLIPDGSTVYVTYKYVPAAYFEPVLLSNLNDVTNRFGSLYKADGETVNSPLSYGAAVAFENGAQELVLQPLYYLNSGKRQAPTEVQAAESGTWAKNFENLRDITTINLIVPVVGQSQANVNDAAQLSIIQAAQDHAKFMKSQQQYIFVVAGEDSSASSGVATAATVRTHAQTLAARYGEEMAEQTVIVNLSKFFRSTPAAEGTQVGVGGQYMACAIAASIAARPISSSLTRKAVSGFTAVGERRELAAKNADAASGLLVVESKGNVIQVRHGITINTKGGAAKREISVVRAKHAVVESLMDTIETQVIGTVIADAEAPLIVRAVVISVLEELRLAGDIVGYESVQAAISSLDPTTVEVRFSYRPAFPVNYVDISFSLNLSTGSLETE